jgi:glucose-6-phosphate 1-dehydrogenase
MNKPENQILVIFGASGDLTKRKLIPALYSLDIQDLIAGEKFAIIGVSRSGLTDEAFRTLMREGPGEILRRKGSVADRGIFKRIYYQSVDAHNPLSYRGLCDKLAGLQKSMDIPGNTICYLSTPPSLYGIIPQNLAKNQQNLQTEGWKRLIIEKPFGYDLQSAVELNDSLKERLAREPDLPHRPLPWQGNRSECIGYEIYQRYFRAVVEP